MAVVLGWFAGKQCVPNPAGDLAFGILVTDAHITDAASLKEHPAQHVHLHQTGASQLHSFRHIYDAGVNDKAYLQTLC